MFDRGRRKLLSTIISLFCSQIYEELLYLNRLYALNVPFSKILKHWFHELFVHPDSRRLMMTVIYTKRQPNLPDEALKRPYDYCLLFLRFFVFLLKGNLPFLRFAQQKPFFLCF